MGKPRVALVIPAGVPADVVEKLRVANADVFLVVSGAEPGAPTAPELKAYRQTWLTVISILRGLIGIGKTAAVFTGPAAWLAPIAADALNAGLDRTEQAILGNPEVEDWTISRIAAARAAVEDPSS
ncbi:MAG TPA: hypothetical protein PKW35_15460 [Nannocystaceae bacterium]|nr:hypothetical protein [Nannocystaceae bacterium]